MGADVDARGDGRPSSIPACHTYVVALLSNVVPCFLDMMRQVRKKLSVVVGKEELDGDSFTAR